MKTSTFTWDYQGLSENVSREWPNKYLKNFLNKFAEKAFLNCYKVSEIVKAIKSAPQAKIFIPIT